VALKMLECEIAMRDIMACDTAVALALAKQFQTDPRVPEDAFDRLNHITKQVWSLVNMLAFSNLFRFADHIVLPNPEDSIFIPYIPTQPFTPESESESDNDDEANATYWLNTLADWTAADRSNKSEMRNNKSEMNAQTMNTPQQQRTYFKEIAEMLADEKITTEQACSLIEDLRDAGITADVMHSHQEQEKGFKEIAELLADRKITTEEACGLFTEWMTEWSGWLL